MIFDSGIIYDTDFIISLLFENQSTHQQAVSIQEQYKENSQFIVLDIITFDFATTVSRLYNQKLAIEVTQKVFNQDKAK